jgi:hypothetical protein
MAFEQLQAVINDGIAKQQQTCVQICVSVDGRTQLNAGFGSATDQIAASAETIMLWPAEQGELATADAHSGRLWQIRTCCATGRFWR